MIAFGSSFSCAFFFFKCVFSCLLIVSLFMSELCCSVKHFFFLCRNCALEIHSHQSHPKFRQWDACLSSAIDRVISRLISFWLHSWARCENFKFDIQWHRWREKRKDVQQNATLAAQREQTWHFPVNYVESAKNLIHRIVFLHILGLWTHKNGEVESGSHKTDATDWRKQRKNKINKLFCLAARHYGHRDCKVTSACKKSALRDSALLFSFFHLFIERRQGQLGSDFRRYCSWSTCT